MHETARPPRARSSIHAPTPGFRPRSLRPTRTAAALIVLLTGGLGLAQIAIAPLEPPRTPDVRGHVALLYAARLADADPNADPLAGLLLASELAFDEGDRTIRFRADPIGIDRQALALDVQEGREVVSASYELAPETSTAPERREATILVSADPEDGPRLQTLLTVQHDVGPDGSTSVVAGLTASDRYQAVAPNLASLAWRASLQRTTFREHDGGLFRNGWSLRGSIGGDVPLSETLRLRPDLSSSLRWTDASGGTTGAPRQRHALGGTLEIGSLERIGASATLAVDPESERPWTAALTVSGSTDRFDPLSLDVGLDLPVGDPEQIVGASVGAALSPLDGLDVGAGYRVRWTTAGAAHGVDGSVGYRSAWERVRLRADAEGSLAWEPGEPLATDLTLRLAATSRRSGPLTFRTSGSVRFADGEPAGSLRAGATLDAAPLSLSLDGDLGLSEATTLSVAAGAVAGLTDRLGIELRVATDTTFAPDGGTAASIAAGLRHTFGGER